MPLSHMVKSGLAFQIADDALDYFSKEKILKQIGKDFFEGKVTSIIIVFQNQT